MSDREPESLLRRALLNGAHLTVLTTFALAQPLFDILGQNPEFFAVRGSSAAEIVVFALAVVFALPVVLVAIETLVGLASPGVARGLHLVFVGVLTAAIALHVSTNRQALTGLAALLLAGALGAAAAILYSRARAVRTFLTVLVPVPLVFLGLFLVGSPVSKLVFLEEAHASTAVIASKTPVVMVVFDELPTAALMDRAGRIDARRWPSFGALARDATWFRNATTVHSYTSSAVPALLTGELPKDGQLPTFADHPDNLFTFLRGSYELNVWEVLHLCPPSLCPFRPGEGDENAVDDTESLASDASIVYLHLLLPEPYASDLPSISDAWGDFGQDESAAPATSSAGRPRRTVPACERDVCAFASSITARAEPTLHFFHASLPHTGWEFLPSGKRYEGSSQTTPGEVGALMGDPWLKTQAQQRLLLQVGYTDRALGRILRRLRATGVYDRALVVVTADHGESFLPGMPRRDVVRGNLADIAFVPLFLKLPGLHGGRVDDSFARTVDVVPTIADVLGALLPWRADGRSLVGSRPPRDTTVRVLARNGTAVHAPLARLLAERARGLARQVAVFGTGPVESVYRIGPHRDLLGRRLGDVSVRQSRDGSVELDGRELLRVVDLSSDFLPSYLTGSITGSYDEEQPLAIAVDGTIHAVTRTYRARGETRFAAFVPESALRHGANEVVVLAIEKRGARVILEELRSDDLVLELAAGGQAIEASDGTRARVRPAAISGEVRVEQLRHGLRFLGWAADLKTVRAADRVVVFVDGRSAFLGRTGESRRDIRVRYGPDKSGFTFTVAPSLLPEPGEDRDVRVFAIAGGVASELPYVDGSPWAG